jgi:hypothetical protein
MRVEPLPIYTVGSIERTAKRRRILWQRKNTQPKKLANGRTRGNESMQNEQSMLQIINIRKKVQHLYQLE